MKKVSIIFLLFIFGCVGSRSKKFKNEDYSIRNNKVNIFHQYWNLDNDSLNLFLNIEFPIKFFVFKKENDQFISNVSFTLIISDVKNDIQVYRESWTSQIIKEYYEETRNNNFHNAERNIRILPGEYKVFINLQDKDSRRNSNIEEILDIKSVDKIGPILIYLKNKQSAKYLALKALEKVDSLFLKVQLDSKGVKENNINYLIRYKESIIDSGLISLETKNINNIYYIGLPMKTHNKGLYEIELSYMEEKQVTTFYYSIKGDLYWTNDIEELVGVMKYIISKNSEYKKLKEMDESLQWNYINSYWLEKDPSPGTEKNELIEQLNKRMKYVNKNFSILMPGWRSDRGRIYIIYGQPNQIKDSYDNSLGFSYQTWIYSGGKKFKFVDRGMSGDYTLYRTMF